MEYVEGIPGEFGKYFKKNKRNLIILNNLMNEASKSLKITQLLTGGCHDNISVTISHTKFILLKSTHS